jgi:uncharacterized membrane protein YpjA
LDVWIFDRVAAYAAVVVAALLLRDSPTPALFIVGGALLVLVAVGIHNAWDLITSLALQSTAERNDGPDDQQEGNTKQDT